MNEQSAEVQAAISDESGKLDLILSRLTALEESDARHKRTNAAQSFLLVCLSGLLAFVGPNHGEIRTALLTAIGGTFLLSSREGGHKDVSDFASDVVRLVKGGSDK